MMQFPDLNQDSMTAELNYRRERLTGAHYPGQARVRRSRLRRSRARTRAAA
jgi:hypothetical protein